MEKLRYQCVDCAHKGVSCEPYQRYSRIDEINECEDYVNKTHIEELSDILKGFHRMASHKIREED